MGTPKSNLQLWIDLAKWFITSVAVVVATMIIDYGFKDRQAGLAELKFYDKYVTELIVLNSNPVQKKMLAQYFACVTPTEKLRERWIIYHDSVYKEYMDYITPYLKEDSVLTGRMEALISIPGLTDSSEEEILRIEARRDEIYHILYPEVKLPEPEGGRENSGE